MAQEEYRLRAIWIVVASVIAACNALPNDPEGTLDEARGGTLHVGVTEAPPWVSRVSDDAVGIEPDLVRGFAESIDATVEWKWAPVDEHMHALESFDLDLLAAGLTKDDPWRKRVAFTRPYRHGESKHVFAAPPGENALVVAFETYLEEHPR